MLVVLALAPAVVTEAMLVVLELGPAELTAVEELTEENMIIAKEVEKKEVMTVDMHSQTPSQTRIETLLEY